MITDMDRIEGFEELVLKIPKEQRKKRLGQRYPLVPDISDGSAPARSKAPSKGSPRTSSAR